MHPWMLHAPYEPYAYALNADTLRVVLLVERGKCKSASVHFADRYVPDLTLCTDMVHTGTDELWDYYSADLSLSTLRIKYAFHIVSESGFFWFGESGIGKLPERAGVFQKAYICEQDVYSVPDWTLRSVCYQIFPDRFCRGNKAAQEKNFSAWDSKPTAQSMFGGDLNGISEKLDYLESIHVNVIYLTPIFQSPSNHKYDTADYFEVDSQFGTKDDLRHLVARAHQKGIRVILDAVFNHSGMYFAPFQDVIEKGRQSAYWDWFYIDGNMLDVDKVNYRTFATGLASMPKLKVSNPEVEKFLIEVGTYWIREFDIDGWRLDVANEVSHTFWCKFREAIKAEKQDALIIGEVWHNSLPWLTGNQFDGVMNYLFRDMVHDLVITKKCTPQEFSERVSALNHRYPVQATQSMFNLLGSHDTARIFTLAKKNTAAIIQAVAIQFMFPGIPMVYYGDEIGMLGKEDPDCRRGMIWDETKQNARMKEAVQILAGLKTTLVPLQSTNIAFTKVEENGLEFVRWSEHSDEEVHVALGFGGQRFAVKPGSDILYASKPNKSGYRSIGKGDVLIWKVRRG